MATVHIKMALSPGKNGKRLRIILSTYKWCLSIRQNGRHPQVKMALSPGKNGKRLRITLSTYKGACPHVKMVAVHKSKWRCPHANAANVSE
jgi:hypothetical protein